MLGHAEMAESPVSMPLSFTFRTFCASLQVVAITAVRGVVLWMFCGWDLSLRSTERGIMKRTNRLIATAIVIVVTIMAAALAKADSFTNMEVLQPGGAHSILAHGSESNHVDESPTSFFRDRNRFWRLSSILNRLTRCLRRRSISQAFPLTYTKS